jgi:hypothetical protein
VVLGCVAVADLSDTSLNAYAYAPKQNIAESFYTRGEVDAAHIQPDYETQVHGALLSPSF